MAAPVLEQNSPAPRVATMNRLREWLASKGLRPGDALPAERDLADTLGCTRHTLRWSLDTLETEGTLRRQGERTRLLARSPASAAEDRLLSEALVVVAGDVRRMDCHAQPGWAEYVALGALHAAAVAGRMALQLSRAIACDDPRRLLHAGTPAAVLLPEVVAPGGESRSQPALRQALQRFLECAASAPVAAGREPCRVVVYGDDVWDQAFDRVISDHRRGAGTLVEALVTRGRRRMLFMDVGDACYWMRDRREGYLQAMRTAGLAPRLLPVGAVLQMAHLAGPGDVFSSHGFQALVDYTAGQLVPFLTGPEPVDAILVPSDGEVPRFAAALRKFGLEPNREVLLAGYDHYWADVPERRFESTGPAISIDKHNWRIGEEIVRLALEPCADGTSPRRVVLAPTLVDGLCSM